MPPERYQPDDPRAWLTRARGDLAIASAEIQEAYLEDLCFHAQQAAEKAIKALFLHLGVSFPYVHDLAVLINGLELAGQTVPAHVRQAAGLTDYAVEARYPGPGECVTEEDWQAAVSLAEGVVGWVADLLSKEGS